MWKEWIGVVFPDGCDAGSKLSSGTRETTVGLDGWCEGGLGPQRNDGGGCAKDRKEWRVLVHMNIYPGTYEYIIMFIYNFFYKNGSRF